MEVTTPSCWLPTVLSLVPVSTYLPVPGTRAPFRRRGALPWRPPMTKWARRSPPATPGTGWLARSRTDPADSCENGAQNREAERQAGKIHMGRMAHYVPERKPRCGTNAAFGRTDHIGAGRAGGYCHGHADVMSSPPAAAISAASACPLPPHRADRGHHSSLARCGPDRAAPAEPPAVPNRSPSWTGTGAPSPGTEQCHGDRPMLTRR